MYKYILSHKWHNCFTQNKQQLIDPWIRALDLCHKRFKQSQRTPITARANSKHIKMNVHTPYQCYRRQLLTQTNFSNNSFTNQKSNRDMHNQSESILFSQKMHLSSAISRSTRKSDFILWEWFSFHLILQIKVSLYFLTSMLTFVLERKLHKRTV